MKRAILSYREHRYILGSPICLIGRDPDCDLVLSNPSISRRHAVIVRTGSRFVILDYKSSNGLFVNGEPVFRTELSHGDEIRLGDETLRFSLQGHFKFGPTLQVDNYDGLLKCRDFREQVAEALGQLAVSKRSNFGFVLDFPFSENEGDIGTLAARALDALVSEMEADHGFIALYDEGESEMDVRALRGLDANDVASNPFYAILMKEAFVNSQLVTTTEALFEYFYQEPRIIFLGVGAAICVPVFRFGAPAGLVYLDRSMTSEAFTGEDEKVLALFTYRLSLAFDDMLFTTEVRENLQLLDILVTRIAQGGSAIRCEICGDPIMPGAVEDLVVCRSCHTIHHRDCWDYNGGCPIYGCDSRDCRSLDKI